MAIREDYLMRMILDLARGIARVLKKSGDKEREQMDLEEAIADAVNMDPELFFILEPESMVMMLQIGDLNPSTAEYVVRAMCVDAQAIREAGDENKAQLRERQALAIARAYEVDVDYASESMEELAQPFMDALSAEEA